MPDGKKLSEFVAWCRQHITGDEKGQAQIYLDRRFQLLALHQEVAAKIGKGEAVISPGNPKVIPTPRNC